MRLSLFGSGAGSTVAAILDAIADGRIAADPALVISNNSGAGVVEVAARHGVPTAHLSSVTHPGPDDLDAAVLAALDEAGTDLVVLAGYMKKLGPRVLAAYDGRVVNVHPALLPSFPGLHPVEEALAAGVAETGATVHLVDEGVDTGPVLRQARVPVLPGDTVETLHARIREAEYRLLPEVVRELIAG